MKPSRLIPVLVALLLLTALAAVTVVSAQGLLGLDWWTVDGGGGLSQGDGYSLHGSLGQPDAAQSSGGQYSLSGGFWAGGAPAEVTILVHLPFVLKH